MQYSKQKQIGKRKRPKQKERNRIKSKDYNKAVEVFGATCFCGKQAQEMHHIKLRSSQGRGTWRNLQPLCMSHHNQAHQDYEFRKRLEIQRMRLFGQHFYMDAHDLHEKGIIAEPTEELMEAYFSEVVWEKSQ